MQAKRPEILMRVARVALLGCFVWLAARFWHPYYGFTRFLQLDTISAATTLPELREAPLFTYEYGYDGHYYAQLAARPAVDDPALAGAIDNVGYRARRILLSWLAWAAGGGDAVAAVRAYAWLNLVIWIGLAVLLWGLLAIAGWRGTVAWAGVLFSAGVLHSVRQALTDLLALLIVAAAAILVERRRGGIAATLLGLGGLARETVMLGIVTLWPDRDSPRNAWVRAGGWALIVVLPLAAWLSYLRWVLGPTEPGLGNFTLPVTGWAAKWGEVFRWLRTEPDRYLAITTLLAHLALTVQAAFILLRPAPRDGWWRLGAAYTVLMLFLGTAVWEGHPGAATRVLLPLTLAFNVLAVRRGAGWPWFLLGNLSVLSGLLTMWQVPHNAHELAAGRTGAASYVVRSDENWYATEVGRTRQWAWCAREGQIQVELQPRTDTRVNLRIAVKGFTARPLEIRHGGRVRWHGDLDGTVQWISLPDFEIAAGRAELDFASPAPPLREGGAGGRELGFAIYGVTVD